MNIRFSRHSKRRLQLYNINETDIINEIEKYLLENSLPAGKVELMKKSKPKYKYPLKIIFEKNYNGIIVITVYPLKKGKK